MNRTHAAGLTLWILVGFVAIWNADTYLEAVLGFTLVVSMTVIGVVRYDARGE